MAIPHSTRRYIGQKFNFLVVSDVQWNDKRKGWDFVCDCCCGNRKTYRPSAVTSGGTKSCGCQSKRLIGNATVRHGMKGTPEYEAYSAALGRCTRKSCAHYRHYGGRGIKFLFTSFEQFIAVVGLRPSEKHSLDRIDNDGNYEPGNVRWADTRQQASNKRTNHYLEVGGVRLTISQWAERTGVSKVTIRDRISKGWTPEQAIAPPRF